MKPPEFQLAVPLYQGGSLTSRVREAIANEDRARQELENARRTADFNANQAYFGITNGIAQLRALEAAVASSQSQLASTQLGQRAGLRTQVDILNAQQLLFSARRDFAQSKYTYVLSLLRLEAAVGELTEATSRPSIAGSFRRQSIRSGAAPDARRRCQPRSQYGSGPNVSSRWSMKARTFAGTWRFAR